MPSHLTAIPNVSGPSLVGPGIPCEPALVAVYVPEPWLIPGREVEQHVPAWLCFPKEVPCPAGSTLYVSSMFGYRICTMDEPKAVQLYGPNVADLASEAATPVPSLSTWALLALGVALAIVGLWRSR